MLLGCTTISKSTVAALIVQGLNVDIHGVVTVVNNDITHDIDVVVMVFSLFCFF